MFQSLFFFLLFNAFLLYAAWRLSDALLGNHTGLIEKSLASWIILFSQITATVLALGSTGPFLNLFNLLVINGIISGMVIICVKNPEKRILKETYGRVKTFFSSRDYVTLLLLVMMFVQMFWSLLKIIYFPPTVYDVLTYHLTPAVEWYQQETIPVIIPTQVDRINSMPLGLSVLSYWCFIFLRDSFLVELPQWLWAILLPAITYSMMRRFDVPPKWAIRFSATVYFIPAVMLNSISVKDHLALNVSFLSALLLIKVFTRTKRPFALWITGAALGLTMGYKLTGPAYFFILWFFTGVFLLKHQPEWFKEPAKLGSLILNITFSSAITLAVGGYWYMRNLALYGSIKGSFTLSVLNIYQESFLGSILKRLSILKLHLLNAPHAWLDYRGPYFHELSYISGFGPIWLSVGLIGLFAGFYFVIFKKRCLACEQLLIFYPALALILIYYSIFFSPWDYRLMLFFPILMVIYAAVILEKHGFLNLTIFSSSLTAVLVLCCAWSLFTLFAPIYIPVEHLKQYTHLPRSQKISSAIYRYEKLPYDFFQNAAEPEEPVAYLSDEDSWSYIFYDHQWKRRIFAMLRPKHYRIEDEKWISITPEGKSLLEKNNVRLLCTSISGKYQFFIEDQDFAKIYPGLYCYEKKSSK